MSPATLSRAANPGTGQGNFFAVDRRAWARVCKLNINAMTGYLVLARGTGHDQRTTSWSINAIETYTGISRPRAQQAIKALVQSGLVRTLQQGTRPRYSIVPPHEIPDCEGYLPSKLEADEETLLAQLASGTTFVKTKGGKDWPGYRNPRTVVADLVKKGRARPVGDRWAHHYWAVVYDTEAAAKPDWIWLPNAVIDGASGETAPVELVRQTQNSATLRLLIELYHAHSLASDGGVHWRSIRQEFTRYKVGQQGPFVVYGFEPGSFNSWRNSLFVLPYNAGNTGRGWAEKVTFNALGIQVVEYPGAKPERVARLREAAQ